jgi:lysophospholipase L1-like esterase
MSNKHLVNRGISGDNVSGVFDRLDEITKGNPKKIFLKIGINDVSHHQTSDFIVSRIAEIVEKIKSDSPHTQVYIQSLLPINESIGIYTRLNGRSNQITEINTKLKALAKNWNLAYIDLYPLFTEPGTQTLRANLTGDGLHISEEGYKIWREELKKYL